jgi:beta-lactamase regulating signal transducer with metallopeptidase domain
MNELLIYLIKANLALAFLYSIFHFFFKNTTLHQVNRAVLLFILLFSATIPLLQFKFLSIPEPGFSIDNWSEEINFIPYKIQDSPTNIGNSFHINFLLIGQLLYLTILGILFIRFILQLADFKRIIKNSTPLSSDVGRLVVSKKIKAPFAFLKWIFIPEDLRGEPQMNRIIAHEKVHAKHLHTLDLLITELFCIIFWFNPFVFLLKRSLKTVHEYIADHESAKSNSEKIELLSLLASGVNLNITNGISSNFYWSTLKKRINMITKNKSSKLRELSYLLLIPTFGFILMSFSGFVTEPSFISTMKLDFGNDIPSIHPIKDTNSVRITIGYGMRIHPIYKTKKLHSAIDFKTKMGAPIVATADGIVMKAEFRETSYGKVVIIKHSETYSTLYAHMSEFKVKEGDKVTKGQIIGFVGNSGLSTGPHLHYEVIKDGKRVNPADNIPKMKRN